MERTELSSREAAELGSVDSVLYSHYFFPRAAKVRTPEFHREIWAELENPDHRYFAAMVFRDGAKTTLLRLYVSKRIAYGISRTILFVGKGEDGGRRSVEWVMRNVERNTLWASTFGLVPGNKWTSTELEIVHMGDDPSGGTRISLLALGITGQTRGVNIEDSRPDLIVVDDPCDLENSATPEARQKMNELFFGAIYQSLAPTAEQPLAKLALLQTPLAEDDLITTVIRDPSWHGVRFSCFNERGESRWPERKPTEELKAEKAAFISRNQSSIWYREMECELVAPEENAFRGEWLKTYTLLPPGGITVLAVDPVPPPSNLEIQKGLRGKDLEVLLAMKRLGDDYYLLDYRFNKGHTPEWTISEFFSLALSVSPRPMWVVVESVAYQRTLAWLIRQAMSRYQQFFPVEEMTDRRKKLDRIQDSLSGIAASGHLYVRPEHTEFVDQFRSYPRIQHDDILDAASMAVMKLQGLGSLAGAFANDEGAIVLPPPPPRAIDLDRAREGIP